MKYSRDEIEIMSPVGSYESLQAVIQGGANSVYFGVEHLNMRSKSVHNFNTSDLREISGITKANYIKSYLTVNTVIYDSDLPLMWKIIDEAKNAGISAIIASDIAAIEYANIIGIETHISTQLNISNIQSLKFYAKYADVIVLARELSLDQITEISHRIELENISGPSGGRIKLELFVHGALCMSISGKCFLSLHEYNESANRGECLQLCRRGYTVIDNETGNELNIDNEYIMSPKDLCTIEFLDRIIDAGVQILKIEGRARSPEYVKTVTRCYREAVDSIFENTYSQEKKEDWLRRLSNVFNRGFWNGYYLGQRLGEWSNVYGSKANKKKIYVGKGVNYFPKIQVAEFLIESDTLNIGDEILIIGPTTGVIETSIKEIRVNLMNVNEAKKGDHCSIPLENTVRRSDKLYKVVPSNQL